MTRVLFAIDPGKSGRIVAFHDGELHDAGITAHAWTLATCIKNCRSLRTPFRVVIEHVNGAPGQSGPASFNFGKAYGELLGVCVALDVEPVLIRPVDWKGALGLRREFGESNARFKGRSLALAREIWPQHADTWFRRAKDDGAAEAALLGHYVTKEGIV